VLDGHQVNDAARVAPFETDRGPQALDIFAHPRFDVSRSRIEIGTEFFV
jgi:hypothetical protein